MLPSGQNRSSSWGLGEQARRTLTLWTPVKQGQQFVRDITAEAEGWQRSIRLNGGYWIGKYTVRGKTLAELTDMFYNLLGWHVQESVQGVMSWEGMIYEMVLNTPNASRVKSFDQMYNLGRVKYIDGAGADQLSSVYSQATSRDRYGSRVFIGDVGKLGSTAAETLGATYLAEHAWPWARPQASGRADTVSLDITVCGYIFTANWRWSYVVADTTSTIHDEIQSIVTTFCDDYLLEGTLAANTTSIERIVGDDEPGWMLMHKMVKAGDASGNLYRAFVGSGRRFYYEQVSKTPQYYIVKGQIQSSVAAAETINPWTVQPGVFRDMDFPVSTTEPGSYLDDVRDMIVEEVTCGVNSGLSWQALDFSESEQLAALQDALGEQAAGGSGGTVVRSVTDEMLAKMGVSRAKWAKMTPKQRRALKKKHKV